MKIIEPKVERISEQDPLKRIEIAGRTCYKSESRITEGSAEKFVKDSIDRGHESVIEHANIIITMDTFDAVPLFNTVSALKLIGETVMLKITEFPRVVISGNARMWRDFFRACLRNKLIIPSNIRALGEKHPILFPELYFTPIFEYTRKYFPITFLDNEHLTDEEKLVHACETFRITCDRGVSHEIVRHRPASYSQESTRYCNYSKSGFGNELTFISPSTLERNSQAYRIWERDCDRSESAYFDLLIEGCTPQEARAVLPNSLKTEVVMTADLREWRHFLTLRCDPAAHPDMRVVAKMLMKELRQRYPEIFKDIEGGE